MEKFAVVWFVLVAGLSLTWISFLMWAIYQVVIWLTA